jgi:hypothetical protein
LGNAKTPRLDAVKQPVNFEGIQMQTYLERYVEGDHLGVWSELVALGPAVRKEPVFSDAQSVAHEMMERTKHNIQILVERLGELGYRFISPSEVYNPPDPDLLNTMFACGMKSLER